MNTRFLLACWLMLISQLVTAQALGPLLSEGPDAANFLDVDDAYIAEHHIEGDQLVLTLAHCRWLLPLQAWFSISMA